MNETEFAEYVGEMHSTDSEQYGKPCVVALQSESTAPTNKEPSK